MSMEFTFQAADGSDGKISSAELQSYMQSAGINAIMSPDGMTGKITQNGEEFEGSIRDIIEQDYGKVLSALPSSDATDYSTIDNALKSGIAQFSSDSLKSKYLNIAMENAGIQDAKIVGSGDDWFRYDPATGTYAALTNKPGAELSDALTYAPQAARFVGSALGSAPGVLSSMATGPVGLAAAAGGAAAGGLAGKQLSSFIQQQLDPNFDQTMKQLTSEEVGTILKDTGVEALTDAVGGVIPGVALKPVQEFFAKGALTRGLGWGARGAEAGTKAAQQLAKLGSQSELVRGITTAVAAPPVAAVQGAGFLMQAPQWLGTKGLGYLGKGLDKLGYKNAAASISRAASNPRGKADFVEEGVKDFANLFMPDGIAGRELRPQARDMFGNLSEEFAEGLFQRGVKNLDNIADPAEAAKELTRLQNQRFNLPKMGEIVGRTADASATLGRGLEQAVDKGAKVGFQALDKGMGAASAGARTVRTAADIAAPLEGRAYLQGAKLYSEEQLPWRRKQ